MIRSIRLQYFQGHIDSLFEFGEGVTSIVGVTDAGKTACIRALRWLVNNRPLGTSFINHSAFHNGDQIHPCIVTVETDKHVIERERFATINKYTVDDCELDAVSKSVPDEVIDALNFSDITMQFQLDAPFLLTESSGAVARMLNRVVKLELIDTTQQNIGSYKRKITADKKTLVYEQDVLQKKIDAIDYTKIESVLEIAELLQEKQSILVEKSLNLQSLINDITDVDEMLAHTHEVDACGVLLDKAIELYHDSERIAHSASSCMDVIESIERVDDEIYGGEWVNKIDINNIDKLFVKSVTLGEQATKLDKLLTGINNLVIIRIPKIDIGAVDKLYELRNKLKRDEKRLYILLENIVELSGSIDKGEDILKLLETKLKEDTKGVCPLCGK